MMFQRKRETSAIYVKQETRQKHTKCLPGLIFVRTSRQYFPRKLRGITPSSHSKSVLYTFIRMKRAPNFGASGLLVKQHCTVQRHEAEETDENSVFI
jgi:hypothetical protein